MTNFEFAEIVAYVSLATRTSLTPEAQVVYFDLLGDLPAAVLKAAAQRVVLEHKYPSFPSVAELRAAAVESREGEVSAMSPAEAWELGWKAIGRIDLDIDGSKDRHLASLPPAVVKTINALGLANLIHGKDPVPVVRAQFVKAYEQIANRDRLEALLPGPVREAISANARPVVLKLADAMKLPEAVT